MPDTPTLNETDFDKVKKLSCAVCWQDFGHVPELDDHIRSSHPDRICTEEEFFARRDVA